MTLQVPFDQFVKTAERFAGSKEAFVSPHTSGAMITSAKPSGNVIVVSVTELSPKDATQRLKAAGMETFDGVWSLDGEIELGEHPMSNLHIAAVAYESADARPGIWVDAYSAPPTQVLALRSMYEEMRKTGELDDVSFEEFVRLANPTVVTIGPAELLAFLDQKRELGCD